MSDGGIVRSLWGRPSHPSHALMTRRGGGVCAAVRGKSMIAGKGQTGRQIAVTVVLARRNRMIVGRGRPPRRRVVGTPFDGLAGRDEPRRSRTSADQSTPPARYPMSRFRTHLAIAALAALALAGRAAADAPGAIELKKGDHVLFFGDSLTQLAGDEKPKEHVKKGYVRIVRETLEEKHPTRRSPSAGSPPGATRSGT